MLLVLIVYSFLLLSSSPWYGCITVYSFAGWRIFGLFPVFLSIMNSAAMDTDVQVFMWTYIFIPRGHVPRNGMTESHGRYKFKLSKCFPQWLYHFTFPSAMSETSSCFISLKILGIFNYLNSRYFAGCVVVSDYGLVCISLMTNNVKQFFVYIFAICMSSVRWLFMPFAHVY